MMRQQVDDVLQSHLVAATHWIASVPVCSVPARPCTVLEEPLM